MGTLLKGDIGHAYNNFKKAAGMMEGEAKGMWWHDGDFYKWMEAATYVYANNRDESILKELDEIIDVIGKAQEEDGYLSTAIQTRTSRERWSDVTSHELYNSGHLLTIECFCCPPNLVRTIAKCAGWAYSLSENGVAVSLYGANRLNTKLLDGSTLELSQDTHYPWDGAVKITVKECRDAPMEIMLRIPEWAAGTRILVNGKAAGAAAKAGTYATISRTWKAGDLITLDMPMDIKLMEGHPRIEEVRNQVAIKRGPIVYCVESPDLPADTGILDVYLPGDSKLKTTYQEGVLGGLTTIRGKVLLRKDKKEGMYRAVTKPTWETCDTQFVPYYSWCNRGQSEMTVFLPVVWQ